MYLLNYIISSSIEPTQDIFTFELMQSSSTLTVIFNVVSEHIHVCIASYIVWQTVLGWTLIINTSFTMHALLPIKAVYWHLVCTSHKMPLPEEALLCMGLRKERLFRSKARKYNLISKEVARFLKSGHSWVHQTIKFDPSLFTVRLRGLSQIEIDHS